MRIRARVLALGVAVVAIGLLAGCATTPESTPEAVSMANATPQPTSGAEGGIRVAIVGDSLTAGGGRSLASGLTADTWMTYAQGDGIDYVGGWAVGGRTVQQMAEYAAPISKVDVLVLMGGTNDVRKSISFGQTASSYDKVVATMHPKHVIIGAIPPNDRHPVAAEHYQEQLEKYARAKGWDLVDPWGFARHGLVYATGTTVDGIHPTTAGYKKVGLAFRAAILRVSSTPQKG
ncbi:lysophospholipase L1-like esterase [Frondihabitans sp. PhB188]|uniref:SGNH/GDSL hydrolase family protein n=1 Tax=Frondihabitans sp. PhB188 TaxID=2485200 RepID=UPI000F911A3E|nr:SGNH/GDSL hydrolase family protein [Frondihabitans sp. PhB188]ROQ38313.1 lysophospholipase L1-like esterase [Frondihabitans sp. PhB188]